MKVKNAVFPDPMLKLNLFGRETDRLCRIENSKLEADTLGIYKESAYGRETKRLFLIQERDGIDAAIEFARRGIVLYRQCVLKKKTHTMYKENMIKSYLSFKKYVFNSSRQKK